ncbi:MAG: cysteine desulfurase [Lachnospiraceae bacterium]|nr:cysteine desulfurase [Lachnospiraceae bacterium]
MEAYLDNAATTQCLPEAAEEMQRVLLEDFGNPSSLHTKGMHAEEYLKKARKTIAKTLKAQEKEIVFTSGGTESNNLAIFGTARAKRRQGRRILSTQIEHPSVYNPMVALQEDGFETSFLPVDKEGLLSLEHLEAMVSEETILVSIMHVNNEIGSIEPIEEAARIVHQKAPKAIFHVDGVQSYGKLALVPKKMGIDLLSVSGHKLHGPKGSGFLYIREGVYILPILYGGSQEAGFRSGTENVPAIAGLSVAVDQMFASREAHQAHLSQLKRRLLEHIAGIEGVVLNSSASEENSAPHITSISVPGVRAEVMLHALEDKGVYVSSGSACSSNKATKSRTMVSIGASEEEMESAIRFSFSYKTTMEEVDYAAAVLRELVPVLKKFKRR